MSGAPFKAPRRDKAAGAGDPEKCFAPAQGTGCGDGDRAAVASATRRVPGSGQARKLLRRVGAGVRALSTRKNGSNTRSRSPAAMPSASSVTAIPRYRSAALGADHYGRAAPYLAAFSTRLKIRPQKPGVRFDDKPGAASMRTSCRRSADRGRRARHLLQQRPELHRLRLRRAAPALRREVMSTSEMSRSSSPRSASTSRSRPLGGIARQGAPGQPHARQRGAQLMRDVGQKLLLAAHQTLDALRHVVPRPHELLHLVKLRVRMKAVMRAVMRAGVPAVATAVPAGGGPWGGQISAHAATGCRPGAALQWLGTGMRRSDRRPPKRRVASIRAGSTGCEIRRASGAVNTPTSSSTSATAPSGSHYPALRRARSRHGATSMNPTMVPVRTSRIGAATEYGAAAPDPVPPSSVRSLGGQKRRQRRSTGSHDPPSRSRDGQLDLEVPQPGDPRRGVIDKALGQRCREMTRHALAELAPERPALLPAKTPRLSIGRPQAGSIRNAQMRAYSLS